MKKLKLFFALFAMLALGVGNAWAEDYSIKFLTAATDGSTEIATSTKTSTVLESASCAYVTGFTSNCTKAYYKGKSGVKLSSKNAAGTIELTLSNTCNQNISKVVFKTVKYSSDASTLTFYAGTSTLGTIAAGSDFSHTFTTPQSVSTLKIESSKRAYISEIIISVSAGETPGGGETPDPEEPDPTPGTGGESSTATFTYTDLKGQGASGLGAYFTGATKENIHMSGKGNGNNSYVQIYANNYLTFTPTNATITKIVLTATSGYVKTWKASEGTIAVSGDKATWTGNSTSTITLTNTASAQARITQMDVTYTASGSDDSEPVIVKTLKSIAVTGMKTTYEQGDIFKFNGTCTATYSVTKDGVAQADETAEVTPTSVSTPNMNTIGKQTVTVTYSEGGVDKTNEYEITITENTVTAGEYCITPNNEFWGTNFNGSLSGEALDQTYTGRQDDITIQYAKGSGSNLYINASQTRTYNGTTLTFSVPSDYLIKAIAFTADGTNWKGTHTANVGSMTDSKTWAGSANEVTITFGDKCYITKICVTYEAAPVEPTKTLTSIEITTPATQTTFWQGETFNYNGLVVTAHYSDAADEVVTPTVTGSTATAGTATVTVSYKEQSTSYAITVKDIPNTKETAYSVADAYDIIDKLTTAEGVFISGIISQVDNYNSTYKSITYWISADGTTTNQLQVYSGKGIESADFDAVTDLTVGDKVIVCGKLKIYSGTYEFDKNNYLAEHTKTTKDPAGLAYATTSYTANVGEAFTTPELTNPHNLVVTYSTSDASKATVDANSGAVTIVAAGVVTITAATTGDASHDAGSASYTITITDPSLLIATLPFEFNGKQADIEGTAGMTHSGIDADDYKSAPYLKMNTTGDWLIICFDSEPEKLSYDIKNNSFSGGTFSVQESADGETYTDVKVHTEITETQNEEHTLLSTSRYVKFIYTEKSSGNVGLGNIKITKPDTREEAGLTWDPSSVTLTQGDAFTAPTLQNPKSVAGITYESNNDEVATVTAEGEIALGSATGTATITATFAGDATTYKPATATCTITVNEYIETIDGEWELVTDASKLQAGMEIIIASVEVDGKYYTMSKASDNGNNRTAVESTISGKKLNPAVGTSVLTLVDAGNGTFALQAGNGNYLYAASSSANQLKEKNKIDAHGQWTITIADNKATIKAEGSSNRNWMQFNPNNGSPLFSCYAYDKPQKDIALYKRMPDYTREVDPQYYGTICLPKAGKFVGGSLYEVAYYDETTKKVYFDEVLNGEMGAGMPYVFLANATKIEAYYTNDEEAAAQNKNGLCGTLVDITSGMNEDGVYMIYRNQIIHSTHSGSYLNANRAYIKLTEVPGYNDPLYVALAPAPGRKRIAIGQAPQVATGVDQVQGDNVPTKMIVNGQLFILRGEKMYDAQGKLVK